MIGPKMAAQILGLAGGLAALTKIPACNLQVLGQVRGTSSSRGGMSTNSGSNTGVGPHMGVLVDCDLVQACPSSLQRKALKLVAAKLALAIRYDFSNVDAGRPRSAQTGMELRRQLETKLEHLQTPDKAPVLKALPK